MITKTKMMLSMARLKERSQPLKVPGLLRWLFVDMCSSMMSQYSTAEFL